MSMINGTEILSWLGGGHYGAYWRKTAGALIRATQHTLLFLPTLAVHIGCYGFLLIVGLDET